MSINPTGITPSITAPKYSEIDAEEKDPLQDVRIGKTASGIREPADIRGFSKYDLSEQYTFVRWKETTINSFKAFGFSPVELRPFELREHLESKGGIGKQIFGVYRMDGDKLTDLGLPFDHTLPLALFVAQNQRDIPFPFKRQHVGVVYRGENPQAGRFRGFYQADVDVIGPQLEITSDAECLATLITTLTKLKIGDFTTYINHIGIVYGILDAFSIPEDVRADVLRELDKADKITKNELFINLEGILKDLTKNQIEDLMEVFSFRGAVDQFPIEKYSDHAKQSYEDLSNIMEMLKDFGVDVSEIQFAPNIVRGLDYYTGLVFETFLHGKEQYGSVMSGGRYDNLVEAFSPDIKLQGVGGSIGLTRLFDILSRHNEIPRNRVSTSNVFVGYRTQEQKSFAIQLATRLRDLEKNVTLYLGTSSIKKQLENAGKMGIPIVLLAMNDNSFVVKDMNNIDDKRGQDFTTQDEAIAFSLELIQRNDEF